MGISKQDMLKRCLIIKFKLPVVRAVMRSCLEREVRGSNLGLFKSDTMLPTTRLRCNISSKGAVLPRSAITGDGPNNSLHASA